MLKGRAKLKPDTRIQTGKTPITLSKVLRLLSFCDNRRGRHV